VVATSEARRWSPQYAGRHLGFVYPVLHRLQAAEVDRRLDAGLGRQFRPAGSGGTRLSLRLIAGLDAETLATYARIVLIGNGQLDSRDTL
jgi:hypothetical protein